MPRTLKILGIVLMVIGGLGAGGCLVLFMAVLPYLLVNQFGDAAPIALGFVLMLASAAAIIYLGIWLRRKGIRMEEEAWRASLPAPSATDSQLDDVD